jgi:hypothetical protein
MGVRRGDGMNKLVDTLSWVAMRCTQNKYLNAIALFKKIVATRSLNLT